MYKIYSNYNFPQYLPSEKHIVFFPCFMFYNCIYTEVTKLLCYVDIFLSLISRGIMVRKHAFRNLKPF
jgi:hypothetical protein